ncbi:RICIN domain-containing protein [Kribbella sp. NPDC026611]|uniref:RICIN domain-containing protein n=1 Tax=Kribbella sp. NPDC026611 TaxID=3154911 RepID=UPI0034068B4C
MRFGRVKIMVAVAGLLVSMAVPVLSTAAPGVATRDAAAAAAPASVDSTPMGRAQAAARQQGRRVEVEGMRSETGEVYANPDGTKTMEQHALPVRVRHADGWVAPDATLVRAADGTVRAKAAVTPIVLAGGGSSHLLTIGKPGQQLRLGWPGTLPAPRLAGDTATYPEVLPGVDLRIVVGITDFSHLLVVKNRDAARNPALRTVRYSISGDSLRLSVRADGTTVAKGTKGETVFSAPPPTMWDAAHRTARLGLRIAGSTMALTPDQRVLAGPATKYPVLIDPQIGGGLVNWLHVSTKMSGSDQGWTYDRNDEGAKMGAIYDDPANKYRSMFLLNTTSGAQTIAGSQIISATFRITINKSPDGTPRPVQLWWLNDLHTTDVVNWGNQEGYWRQNVATANGEAYPWNEDNPIEFSNDTLKGIIQGVADARRTQVSFGLRAANEADKWQWKKFLPNTATISITYNTPPRTPKNLNFVRPLPCGTQGAPTAIATLQPQFGAIANDPDAGDNVTSKLTITDAAGVQVWTADVGPTVSGAAFSWPEVPAGTLAANTPYRYFANTRDGQATSPDTPNCWFLADTVKPATPVVQSTDFPNGEPVLQIRTAGTVTFKIGSAADTDVAEFLFGYAQDKMTMRVKAVNGTASIPVTLTTDPVTHIPAATLFVKAVDRAGNLSDKFKQWSLQALDDAPPAVTHVRNDVNGDGRADISAVVDQGYGRTTVWNFDSRRDSTYYPGYIGWDSREGSGFNLYRTRPVQADLDGDGRTDLALFREGAGRTNYLYKLISDGNRYDSPPAVWTNASDAVRYPLSTARMIGGDVDGDGKDDLVVQNAGSTNWSAQVFRGADLAHPSIWATAATGNPWPASTPLLADVDGDHKLDLLSMRNLSGCRTTVELYRSTGSAFAAAQTIYDSGAGGFCWEKSRPAVADVDGDGKDDIVALYEYGVSGSQTDAGLTVFRSTGTALTPSTWWRRTVDLDLSKATLTTGDYNADGKDDAAVLYAGGTAPVDRQLFSFTSSGTAFADKVLGWQGELDAVTGPKFDIEHREYELVNRNSGKCLNVQDSSVDDRAKYVQYQCLPLDMNARFHVDPIAGTEQYSLRPVHTAVGAGPMKCADMDNWSMVDGGQLIQWPCGNGSGEPTANQQFTVSYVDGASYDTVVQLKLAHSGKCLSIVDASPADLAPVQQESCGQGSNQQWILRPTFNPTPVGANGAGRYRTNPATNANGVLDIQDCHTEDGSNVRIWDDVAGSQCESWQLVSQGDDVYKVVDPHSSKALDVQGCSRQPTAPVTIWTSNDSECQLWRIEPSPGGTYSVLQVGTGYSLDVAGCGTSTHEEVIQWFYHGGPCQRWTFQQR